MYNDRIVIVGAGGHGKVVLDALLACGAERSRLIVSDDAPALRGTQLLGITIVVPAIFEGIEAAHFHAAIGDNLTRQELFGRLIRRGATAYTVIHPAAVVARSADVGAGAFLAGRAVVAPDASVGAGSIINHGAIVDHDSTVGMFCHVAPNATLGGQVCLGARVLVGSGANILPGIRVGDDAVIGAGAVVTRDIASGATCKGVPAVTSGSF